jgi:hypothetical protein
MSSPVPQHSVSSHLSSIGSSSRQVQPHRKPSSDRIGAVKSNTSSSSLHRSASSKSDISTTSAKSGRPHHHHPHVAHTSASTKHHRVTSFGHRVPSYGKGLNKLTALTVLTTEEEPKEHISIHSIVSRAGGGQSMQRSLSEGSSTS